MNADDEITADAVCRFDRIGGIGPFTRLLVRGHHFLSAFIRENLLTAFAAIQPAGQGSKHATFYRHPKRNDCLWVSP